MAESFFGNWEKELTEEGIKMLTRLGEAYNSGGMDALIEALIDFVLEVRDDINRDEFMAAWKELEEEYQVLQSKR